MIHLLSFKTPFCVQSTQNSTILQRFKQLRITDRMPEPVFVNDYVAQESIPRIRFRKPLYSLAGRNENKGLSTCPPGWESIPGLLKGLQIRALNSLPLSL